MNVIRRIAVPCGIVGGSWAILLSILLSLIISTRMVTTTTIEGQTWGFTIGVAESWAWAILTIIILMALMGLLAMILSKRNPRLSEIFIWISALAMLVISLVSTLIILLPAAILLILAAIGVREPGHFRR